MRTYLECLKEAAINTGYTGNIQATDLWHEDYKDLFERAADMYASQSNSHKHGVSGKQQIQWQAIESYVNRFSTSNEPFRQLLLKQAREWFEGEFVACASGAVDTVAARRTWKDECREAGQDCGCGDICMFAPSARKSSEGQP